MDLLKPIKTAVKKVRNYMDRVEQERQDQEKLEKWKRKLTTALSEHDSFRANCAAWDARYNGTKAVGANVGRVYMSETRQDQSGVADARQVVNITLQLIESQIDPSVPKPNVDAIEGEDDNERKQMVEGMLTYMANNADLERINSENERIVKKNSICIYKVGYNPNYKSHKWIGRIETTNPHPVNVIPQPGVFRVKDMDYLFHIENRTVDYVCRTYGEEFRGQLEDATAEYENIDDLSSARTTSNDNKNGKVSVVEAWYKDKDGDVCLLTWVNDVIIRDVPKFFYKRDDKGNIIESDEVEIETGIDPMTQIPITKIVQVPVHVPKSFPFVIQYNIPKEKSYMGKADPDIIADQQEAIKKVLSSHEEKLIQGTSKVFVRKSSGIANKINNAQLQVLEVDDPEGDVKVVDMKTPENSLLEYYNVVLQAAKDTLGVTEASQGRTDQGTTLSGKALEMLANNSAGRLSTKLFEKNIAYTELYKLYFDFMLAFYDDKRPYRIENKDNKPVYGEFDKAKLIKQDAAGEWYYPEFDIYITADTGLPKDKRFIMDSANQAGNRMDNIEYWMVMESIGYPNASAILKMEQEKQEKMEMMGDAINSGIANQGMPPGWEYEQIT